MYKKNKKIGKKTLSNLSKKPPWAFNKFEKSLRLKFLLNKEKNASPKKKDNETIKEKNKL